MNGFTWSRFIFSGAIIWLLGEDTWISLKDKKTLEALANASAGAAPGKPQKAYRSKITLEGRWIPGHSGNRGKH